MFKAHDSKKHAKKLLRRSYANMVAVCFLIAMLTASYSSSTTFMHYHQPLPGYSSSELPSEGNVNSDIVDNTIRKLTNNNSELMQSNIHSITDTAINLYISKQSIFLSGLRAINSLIGDTIEFGSIFILLGFLFAIIYKYFIANLIFIGEKRYFLESRKYSDTKISKIFYLFKLRCMKNAIYIMFMRSLYTTLWSLTIVMGIIKHYEYYLIPYILAENPNIPIDDAFKISKNIMHGNKWNLFRLHLSFIGWRILSILTLGLLDILYVNPYVSIVDADFYMSLRHEYVRSRLQSYELLNDPLLERVPSEDELLISKALYDDSEGPYTKISYFEPNQYPVFLYSVQPPFKAVHEPHHANRHYDIYSCIFICFLFSIFGWGFELLMQLSRTGTFVNLTHLYGPWIPLYGICSFILLTLVQNIVEWPVPTFLTIVTIYSTLEYILNWLMEYELNIVLIDYSGYFMNLNGRTFLGGSVFFGLLGCTFLYYLAPKWDDFFKKRSKWFRISVCILITIILISDFTLSYLI